MSDVDTIKSFLVSIGFKVDESSEGKFKGALENATKLALTLGAAVAAAATAVGVATAKMASDFDSLYFASQRTGASVETIKAFGYAVSQMGGTAEGATSSLESFARKMREMPALREQVNQFTGAGIGADGKVTLENLEKIGAWFKSTEQFNAQHMAGIWGYDEKTMLAMQAGIEKYAEHYKRIQRDAGLDPEKAAKDWNKFLTAWRSIWQTAGTIIEGALTRIMGAGPGEGLTALSDWFDSKAGWITDKIVKLGDEFKNFGAKFQEGFGQADWKGINQIFDGFGVVVKFVATQMENLVYWLGKFVRMVIDYDPIFMAYRKLGGGSFLPSSDNGSLFDKQLGGEGDVGAAPADKEGGWWDKSKRWVKKHLGMGAEAKPYAGNPDAGAGGVGAGGRSNIKPDAGLHDAISQVANDLGISPKDLAGAMSFETGGTMNPLKWGGDGSKYRGLIQMSPESQRKYYAKYGGMEKATIAQHLEATEAYLRDRGVKPGMGLEGIYSSILAGNAGEKYWDRRDSNGVSARSGAASIRASKHYGAFDALGGGEGDPAAQAAPSTVLRDGRTFSESEHDKLPPELRGGFGWKYSLDKKTWTYSAPKNAAPADSKNADSAAPSAGGAWNGMNWKPADRSLFDATPAPAPGHQSFNNNSSSSSAALHANTTINVHGGNADAGTIAQSVAANQSRINANLIRNMQGAVA